MKLKSEVKFNFQVEKKGFDFKKQQQNMVYSVDTTTDYLCNLWYNYLTRQSAAA
jgi:hypothetical protein